MSNSAIGFDPVITQGGGGGAPAYTTTVGAAASSTLTQAGAYPITSQYTQFTSPTGNSAAVLPASPVVGALYVIDMKVSGGQLFIFPQVGGKIDNGAVNTDYTVLKTSSAVGDLDFVSMFLVPTSATTWRVIGHGGQTGALDSRIYDASRRDWFGPSTFEGGISGAAVFSGGNAAFSASVSVPATTPLAPSGTTQTVDWSTSSSQVVTAAGTTGTLVLTFSNMADGELMFMKAIGKTGRAWTFPSNVVWASGSAPTVTAIDAAKDYFEFRYDATLGKAVGRVFAQNVS